MCRFFVGAAELFVGVHIKEVKKFLSPVHYNHKVQDDKTSIRQQSPSKCIPG